MAVKVEPTYETGTRFKNVKTDEYMRIVSSRYNEDKGQIEHKVQNCRRNFDMFWICEVAVEYVVNNELWEECTIGNWP